MNINLFILMLYIDMYIHDMYEYMMFVIEHACLYIKEKIIIYNVRNGDIDVNVNAEDMIF